MAGQRTMAQLLQAPTEGYEDAIVVPAITADNFELKHDQDSLNSADGGNILDKMPRECLAIIESKSKVRYSRNKPILAKKSQSHAPVKAVEESCVTCSGAHSYRNFPTTDGNVYRDIIQEFISQASAVNYNQGNTNYRPLMMSNQIRPPGFPPAPAYQALAPQTQGVSKEDFSAYVKANDAVMRNIQTQGQNMQNQLNNLTDLITKFVNSNSASTSSSGTLPSNTIAKLRSDLKAITTRSALIGNKEKLSEMSRTSLNEHFSAVLLKKLPKKLRDPGKFLIPCDFLGMAECLALADLGASINLMPFSVWKRLSLSDLTPICMTLELADRSIFRLVGVVEDVCVKVGSFHFLTDFVVVDFDAHPRAPLILGRSFLKTGRALIDVFEGELTLRVGKDAITFNLDQTSRYSANYSDITTKQIDVIDLAREDDFLLEEVDAFLAIEDHPTSHEFYQPYLDPEGDILLLEAFLNDDPSLPPPNQGNYLPEVRKELKICKAKSDKSSVDEPPEVELKDLPPHLEYAFLEGDDKLPIIIAKDLSVEEKTALITVLKSHKRAIAWKLSDIKGIDPEFCTYKILMEEDFEPAVQHQRRVNPKIHDVIKQEVIKLLKAGLIYPISDSPWVSLVHCVPKEGGFTVVENEDNELIPTRLVIGAYQRCMMAIFHDMIKKTMEVFMDDFSVLGNSFQNCLSHLERMLKREFFSELSLPFRKDAEECVEAFQTLKRKLIEAPILIALDWDMSFELMCDASDFAIGAVLGQRQDKHFRSIHYASKTMTEAESNYTTTEKEMLAVVARKPLKSSRLAIMDPQEDLVKNCDVCQRQGKISQRDEMLQNFIQSDKLDDALWAFRTGYKTPIGCTPYKLVYGKACHLPVELKHKAYWALKHANFDLKTASDHRKIFSGKLKSRWSGPFTISQVYPYGTIELSQPDGPNFKVNGHRFKHYFREDIPKVVVPDLQTFFRDH
nr:reverse transcriptase domain-containing protein [Tanacetum cinerariifolium]